MISRVRTLSCLVAAGLLASFAAAGPASAAGVRPDIATCDPGQSYSITGHSYFHLVRTIPTVPLVNKGHTIATLATGVSITGSVSASISGSVTAEESVILASAKEQLGATVTATLAGTWDVRASMSVRPGKVGDIEGGIFRVETTGTYERIDQNCRISKGTVTAYLPYTYGFLTIGG